MKLLAQVFTACLVSAGLAQPVPPTGEAALRSRFTTVYGPSGLINVPSAYVTPQGRLMVGVTLGQDRSAVANYGLIPGIEVGGAYYELTGKTEGEVLANGKVNIVPANFRNVEIGVGVIDVADRLDATFYAVASAQIITPPSVEDQFQGVRVHAGYGSGLFREKLIGGAELLLTPRLSVIGEYDGTDGNFALRYLPNDTVRAQIGVRSKRIFFTLATAISP
ncbi:MAG: hypothetical protein KIT11_03805 [Fimbriimonadaceae bacterium]|nr:hypothetical protein [Fimbriimonadaceae bacterium]QYK56978.1 MAG: hypothetical protein KF733_05720 [Fimbriimonadaceae bacterium]